MILEQIDCKILCKIFFQILKRNILIFITQLKFYFWKKGIFSFLTFVAISLYLVWKYFHFLKCLHTDGNVEGHVRQKQKQNLSHSLQHLHRFLSHFIKGSKLTLFSVITMLGHICSLKVLEIPAFVFIATYICTSSCGMCGSLVGPKEERVHKMFILDGIINRSHCWEWQGLCDTCWHSVRQGITVFLPFPSYPCSICQSSSPDHRVP